MRHLLAYPQGGWESAVVSIAQFAQCIWRLRIFISASALFGATAAAIVVERIPERYLATATIVLETRLEANADQYDVSVKQIDNYVKSQAAMIQDPRVTGLVVDQLGWTESYELAQEFQRSGAGSGRDFRSWLGDLIADRLVLNYTEGSPSFDVGYVGFSPVEAQTMVGLVRDAYIENSRRQRRSEADENAQRLDGEINALRSRMEALERRNAEFSRKNDVILQSDGTSLTEMQLRNAASAVLPPLAQLPRIEGDTVTPQNRQLAELDGEIARLSTTLGPNHPRLQDLRSQRAELASTIVAPRPVATPASKSLEQIQREREAEYLSKADAIATAQRYDAELKALEARFAALTDRREAFSLDGATQRPGASSGGAVKPYGGVYYPRAQFAILGAAGFGAVFALLIGLLFALLQVRVRSTEDLRKLDLPVLGGPKTSAGAGRQRFFPTPAFRFRRAY